MEWPTIDNAFEVKLYIFLIYSSGAFMKTAGVILYFKSEIRCSPDHPPFNCLFINYFLIGLFLLHLSATLSYVIFILSNCMD